MDSYVKQATENSHETIGDDDWLYVSSHDLRVYFDHIMLVEERVNPRIVMDVGGWDNYQSVKPYLGKSSEATIVGEFERADESGRVHPAKSGRRVGRYTL